LTNLSQATSDVIDICFLTVVVNQLSSKSFIARYFNVAHAHHTLTSQELAIKDDIWLCNHSIQGHDITVVQSNPHQTQPASSAATLLSNAVIWFCRLVSANT
jgi:hypothetical protein